MNEIPKKELEKMVSTILKSYHKYEKITHLDCESLPNKDEVVEIILEFREVLFPGYFCKSRYTFKTIETSLEEQIAVIYSKLYKQIYNSIRLYSEINCKDVNELKEIASEKTLHVINKISTLREFLQSDVEAAFEGDPAANSSSEIIFSYPGIFAILVHRIAHELYKQNIPLIPRIMSEYAHALTGIDIHPGASIGKYFFIDHGTGVVIGETTIIGEHVKIYQGVTLGALSTRGGQRLKGIKRHPTLKNYVTVYAGASILGGDTVIGDGVVVGGNVFITKSVESKMKVSVKNQDLQFKNGK